MRRQEPQQFRTFGNVPWGQRGRAGGAGGRRLGGWRAATEDRAVRLVLQDAGHKAPLLVLGQAGCISGQRCGIGLQLVGAQLVEADGPVFSPAGAGLQRGGKCTHTDLLVTASGLLVTTSCTPLLLGQVHFGLSTVT